MNALIGREEVEASSRTLTKSTRRPFSKIGRNVERAHTSRCHPAFTISLIGSAHPDKVRKEPI